MTTTYITDQNTKIDVPDGTTLAQFWAIKAPGMSLPTIIKTYGPEVPAYARGTLPAHTFAKYQAALEEYKASSGKGMTGVLLLGALALGLVLFMRKKG